MAIIAKTSKLNGGLHMSMNMNEMMKKALSLGVGVTLASKERMESFVEEMVKKGELAPNDSKEWISSLMEKGEKERQEWMGIIREQLQKLLLELNVAAKQDIERLEKRIAALEAAQVNPITHEAPAPAVEVPILDTDQTPPENRECRSQP
jgi:polyhydroxyalkanoate synthesis regulator phasin